MLSQYLPPNWVEILLISFSIVLAYFGFTALYLDTRTLHIWQRRISGLNDLSDDLAASQNQQRRLWWQYFFDLFGAWVRPRRQGELTRARSRLIQAGFRNPRDVNIYYGIKFGLMLFLIGANLLLVIVLYAAQPSSVSLMTFAPLPFSALLGTFAPDVLLQYKIRDRKEQIWRGFPDAMDLLVLCMESGLSIDAALYRVSQDIDLSHPLLSQELRAVSNSIRVGQPRAVALRELSQRVDLEDIRSFTSLIIQTEKLGVSITQAMRKISESIRTKHRMQAEELAARLPVKLLFPVTFFFFPGIMVVILMPAVLRLMEAFSSTAGN